MPKTSRADAIRGYFAAYQREDRKAVESAFADGFRFTSPYDDAIDKATYFVRCWPNNGCIKAFDVEKIIEDGNEAFVTYKAVGADGKEFRNTEFFTFDGDRVASVTVYFGARYSDGVFVKQKEGVT